MRNVVLFLLTVLLPGTMFGEPEREPASTRTLRVTLTVPKGGAAPVAGTITLRAVMGPQAPISLRVTGVDQAVAFAVPGRTIWETSVAVPGWWAAPMVIAVQDADVDTAIPLLPTGRVTGHLLALKGNATAKALDVKIDVPPGVKTLPGPPSAETPCSVADDTTFSCDLPAGTLDLAFHAHGYVPVYRWGVKIEQEARKELGPLLLSPGSAVSGFIMLAGKKIEAGKGRVALFIEVPGATGTAFRLSRPIADGPVAGNGFFQVFDVPPGRYVLQATYPGFAPATVSPIHVHPRVESRLKRVIELQVPATFTLRVDPPADYAGKEWLFRVVRASPINNRYGPPIFDGAGHNGVVVLRDQPGGRYRVAIGDASGNPFVAEEFTTAGAGDETHTFHVELVRIKGTLRRGDNPLEATIWFGGRFGDKHVALRANDRGEFRGVLPHAGLWPVTVNTDKMEARLKTDVPKRDDDKESEVELKIPSNHVEGIVVDGADQPLQSAYVRFNTDSDFALLCKTDVRGRFAFDGVSPGPFTVAAEYRAGPVLKSSAPYAATISESDSIDAIRLKVAEGRPVHGRVMSRAGPVIGADVTIWPGTGLENAPEMNVTTGADGIFDTAVAAGFDRALIVVAAPGYALRAFDVAIDGRAVTLNVPEPGGILHVTAPGGMVLFFQDGRLLTPATLFRWAANRGETFTDGKTYHVSDLAPGRYRACTFASGSTRVSEMTRCAEGFLAPYGELHLTIQ